MFSQPLKAIMVAALLSSGVTLAGCASNYDSHTYRSRDVGQAMDTAYGTVVDYRPVKIKRDGEPGVGAVTGAVIGGAVGSEIGEGDAARVAGVVGGAIVGGVIGHAIEEDINTRSGYEYTVRREDGRTFTIVQQTDGPPIRPGTRVRIIYGAHDRIVPDYSGGYYDDRDRYNDRRYDDRRDDDYGLDDHDDYDPRFDK